MKCSHCGCQDVRPSRSGNSRLPWFCRPFLMSYRCRACERRFLRPRWLWDGVRSQSDVRRHLGTKC
jgi:hypothetical protein